MLGWGRRTAAGGAAPADQRQLELAEHRWDMYPTTSPASAARSRRRRRSGAGDRPRAPEARRTVRDGSSSWRCCVQVGVGPLGAVDDLGPAGACPAAGPCRRRRRASRRRGARPRRPADVPFARAGSRRARRASDQSTTMTRPYPVTRNPRRVRTRGLGKRAGTTGPGLRQRSTRCGRPRASRSSRRAGGRRRTRSRRRSSSRWTAATFAVSKAVAPAHGHPHGVREPGVRRRVRRGAAAEVATALRRCALFHRRARHLSRASVGAWRGAASSVSQSMAACGPPPPERRAEDRELHPGQLGRERLAAVRVPSCPF